MSDDIKRRKKSWREIDNAKDRNAPRRFERPGTTPDGRRTSKSYKAELDQFFDSGKASHRIKGLMKTSGVPETKAEPEDKKRLELIRTIRASETFDAFVQAVDTLRKDYDLPDDIDILTRVLEHPSEDAIQDAIQRLLELCLRMSLAQTKAIVMRLNSIEHATEEPKTLALMKELRDKL